MTVVASIARGHSACYPCMAVGAADVSTIMGSMEPLLPVGVEKVGGPAWI